ncbi:MAG TPA: peptidylprolyl isomerase [Terriglobales bacterium]|jgi:peptidyl-prolyl cis-trans isomerase SurA|nr:peptidylprolyl isomerase [Terriglobales bacterium]
MMNKSLLPVLLLLAALPGWCADTTTTTSTVIEEIVARVNNDIITRSELQHSKDETRQELRQQFGDKADAMFAERERDLLRDLIDQQLLLQKAKDKGLNADTELIRRLDEMRKQMNLSSMDELEKAAKEQGVSFEDFKQNLRNQILTQMVISDEVQPKIQITKEEQRKFYEAHLKDFEHPERVRLSEILVSTEKLEPGDQAGVAAAQQKAQRLLEQVRGGAAFDEVARTSSDGPTAAQGGDLGYFQRGTLARGLEDKAFALKPGETTDVVRTKQGFLILKVTEHEQAGVPPLKDVERQIGDQLYYQKLKPALRAYFTKLREDAFIDIRPGYMDTGASPNQTKPVFTTTASQGPKSKKKHKKLGVF